MKARLVIGALVTLCVLSSVLLGCARSNKPESVDSDITENNESNPDSSSTDSSDSSNDPDYEDCPIKKFEKTIDSDGINLNDTMQTGDIFPMALDNNYLYFSNNSFPLTISSFNRKDFSKTEIMTYDIDIEYCDSNKFIYCGCFFRFPCYGNPYGDVYMKAFVGKVGEESKCILYKEVGTSIVASPAELNDTEMVFLCDSERKDGLSEELYKYRVGDEQAKLIYTLETNKRQPIDVTCYNGEIYIIYEIRSGESGLQGVSNRNEKQFCIKRLNSNGEEIDNELFEITGASDMYPFEITVTENNYILQFASQTSTKTVIINRKSKKVAVAADDDGFGGRFNDHIIDGRYIIFYGRKTSESGPQICVFDDKNSELHVLSFKALKDKYIANIVADYNGDVLFVVQDDIRDETRSLVLFKDVVSLIR